MIGGQQNLFTNDYIKTTQCVWRTWTFLEITHEPKERKSNYFFTENTPVIKLTQSKWIDPWVLQLFLRSIYLIKLSYSYCYHFSALRWHSSWNTFIHKVQISRIINSMASDDLVPQEPRYWRIYPEYSGFRIRRVKSLYEWLDHIYVVEHHWWRRCNYANDKNV